MNTTHGQPAILVGVDGSASATCAVLWAAEEAIRRDVPLRLARSLDYGAFAQGYNLGFSQSFFDAMENDSKALLAEAEQTARSARPEVEIQHAQLAGPPAAALVEASKHALLTVVGARGKGGFSELLAGSVPVALAARAHSPVVVVRSAGAISTSNPPELRPDGPVVLGADGTVNSEEAVAWAFEEASLRHAELIALNAWVEIPSEVFTYYDPDYREELANAKAEHERILAEQLAGWQEKYPDVVVRRKVVCGSPKETLVRYSEKAQLVVVGSRGRGGLAGVLLGSTSQALIHHAACPVLVVRHHASPKEQS